MLRAESTDRRRCGAAVACRAVLTALEAAPPPTPASLELAVQRVLSSFTADDVNATYQAFRRGLMPTDAALAVLAEFGCIDGRARITPLGRHAGKILRARAPESITPELPAGVLLTRLAAAPEHEIEALAVRWLGKRPAADAAAELLLAAVSATPTERVAAVDVAAGLGEAAVPAWRAVLDVPELSAYARAVLADQDHCPPPDDFQLRWLAVEAALVALARDGVEHAYHEVLEAGGMAELRPSGHPGEPALADAVAGFVASGKRPRMYQLKIGLDRFRPPVWRRVLVPASATLADLHRVIRVALGWGDDHLHAFTTDTGRYSDPWYGLDDCGDENTVRLSKALPRAGAKMAYVYDFGDSWEHTILVEDMVEVDAELAAAYPTCVGGRGDAPVEDWNPEEPAEPRPFDQADINRTLASLPWLAGRIRTE